MIVAIDGTSSSGKGTLARRLAAHLGLPHLDTGLLYRAVAAAALDAGGDPGDAALCVRLAEGVDPARFDEDRLRGADVGAAASVVASLGPVRQALFRFQRDFAYQHGGAVLDGRDIGTVIAPDAQVKFWVDAAPEERARRRHAELAGRGEQVAYETVLAQVRERDHRDSTRADAPSKPADDAVHIDTTNLTPDEGFELALAVVRARS